MKRLTISYKLILLLVVAMSHFLKGNAQDVAVNYDAITDSLITLISEKKPVQDQVELLNAISYNFRRTNPELILRYGKQAQELAQSIDYLEGQTIALKNIGIGHFKKGSPSDTILYYFRASADLASSVGDHYTHIACFNNSALVHRNRKEYGLSLKFLFSALNIYKLHYKEPIRMKALLLANIGETYTLMGDYEKGDEYLEEAIVLGKTNNYPTVVSIFLDDLARLKLRLHKLEQAKAIVVEAKAFQTNLGDNASLIETLLVSGEIQEEEGALVLAKEEYTEAYNLSKQYKFIDTEIDALICIIKLEKKEGNIEQAIEHAITALGRAEVVENIEQKTEVLKELVNLYEQKEEYKKALTASKEYNIIIDSIFHSDKTNYVAGFEAIYDSEVKQTEIETLELNQQWQRDLMVFGLVLGGSLFAVVFAFMWSMNKKNKDLKIANKKATEASIAKQNFLSTMSHEIRTPMNAVIGFTDILLQEKPRNDQQPYLQNLKTSGTFLMDLLNDVLDYSKLEAEKVIIEQIPFDLEQHLYNVIEGFKISNQNKDLIIEFDYDVPLKHKVLGDPTRLKQILVNLIGNAVKFTPNGYVRFSVCLIEETNETLRVHFEVEDTGIGIPGDKQQLIFESFSQASSATTRQFGGTGLGLSITKTLVELYGGEIKLESKEGLGSVFSFDLLFPTTTTTIDLLKTKSTKALEALTTTALEGLQILLAEDNVFNQKVAIKILERFGAFVQVAQNGKEALEKIKISNFDLVLMDLHMPEMDGYEAIREIKKLSFPTNEVPIIALTAASLEELMKQSDLNHIDYIGKPFKAEELVRKIIHNLNTPLLYKSGT